LIGAKKPLFCAVTLAAPPGEAVTGFVMVFGY